MTVDNQKRVRQIGLKIPKGAYAELRNRAGALGTSPTTVARCLLLRELGQPGECTMRPPRRQARPRQLTTELQAGLEFLRELQRTRVELERAVKLRDTNVMVSSSAIETSDPTVEKLHELLMQIINAVSGDIK
ncbi:hypothetical protein GI582_22995 [Sulfitobacter sp. BDSS02]|nr:hypothetical protein [Sulfitobacter sp. BDSS02]